MKMIVVMSIAEHDKSLKHILSECNVLAFTEMDVEGYKHINREDIGSNWFASERTAVYSKMAIVFLDNEKALEVMNAVKEASITHQSNPFHAVMLAVEQSV